MNSLRALVADCNLACGLATPHTMGHTSCLGFAFPAVPIAFWDIHHARLKGIFDS